RSKESELAGLMRFNNIRVVDSALVPTKPVRPNIPFSAGVGLLVGLAIGFASALARELLDRSIKTAADVERELDTSLLGTLPKVDSSDSGYGSYGPRHRRLKRSPASDAPPELVVHTHPTSAVAEAARAMRTNILFMSPDKPFTRLLVTSAAPSEGKTTVACCLATAMAQAGHRVLLIDCDLRRPRLHKIFRKRNDIGITTGLLDRTLLATADLSTDVEHLSVLPAGPSVPNPAEIIQSTSFARLLDHVQADYDRVVIDSPPLIPVTDAAVLSSLVDGTVVVVRAFKTSKDVGRHALRSLRAVGSRIVGVVLNLVESRSAGYGYYYHYYGSSTDGEDGARAAAE
ncbi:MAG: polysaccharide biosynthesis tyrosine autokinase, partial [Planctomycetales bacterium]|nr:polysaccharide biosynthesis tyrosine autokinase [Planctomycetales bacterium]